jgi:hypothetical protein
MRKVASLNFEKALLLFEALPKHFSAQVGRTLFLRQIDRPKKSIYLTFQASRHGTIHLFPPPKVRSREEWP